MPATQPSKQFHPLCHEHHVGMKVNEKIVKSNGKGAESRSYICTESDCLVHYSKNRGYFVLNGNGKPNGLEMVPKVTCRRDGMPMFLAEVNRKKKSYRLWRCPQCNETRTSDDGLIDAASAEKYLAMAQGKTRPTAAAKH